MIINSGRTRFLFLGSYVVSLLLSSVQVLPGWSLPFLTAIAFFGYKLLDMLVSRRFLYLKTELLLIVVLYLYLIAAELLLHNGTIINNYFISFGLNGTIMLFLADEFYRNSTVREYAMRAYVATAVAVGLLIGFDIMTTISSSGRTTFMMQNENELAAALFIAYVYLSREFVNMNWLRISIPLLVFLSSFVVLLNAVVATGTRFAMVGVIVVASLLTLFAMMDRERMRSGLIYAAFTAAFIAFKINGFWLPIFRPLSSDLLHDRWSPDVHGNNLQDIGGRLQLWQNSLDAFMQSPLIGLGYNNFQQFIIMRDNVFMHPHNFLLEIAAMSGLIGLTLTIAVGLIFIWRISVMGSCKMIQDVLIWGVPVMIIIMMLGITHLKTFWFLLAFYITFSSGEKKEASMNLT
jgi:O-antigen ligase